MQTDLPVPDGPEDHRDLVVRQAQVQAVEDRVAAERLLDVDELDGVRLGALAAAGALGVPAVLVVLAAARRGAPARWRRACARRCRRRGAWPEAVCWVGRPGRSPGRPASGARGRPGSGARRTAVSRRRASAGRPAPGRPASAGRPARGSRAGGVSCGTLRIRVASSSGSLVSQLAAPSNRRLGLSGWRPRRPESRACRPGGPSPCSRPWTSPSPCRLPPGRRWPCSRSSSRPPRSPSPSPSP